MSFGSPTDPQRASPPPRDNVRIGPLKRTADSHVFSFSVRGLLPHTSYRLGISLGPNPVRPREQVKTFWAGLPDGVARSGAPAVAIEGYVANTELKIKARDGNWVGVDDLQYMDPESAVRMLRWKSTIPGVVAGELQISLNPYPVQGEFGPCDVPEQGLIYRRTYRNQPQETEVGGKRSEIWTSARYWTDHGETTVPVRVHQRTVYSRAPTWYWT